MLTNQMLTNQMPQSLLHRPIGRAIPYADQSDAAVCKEGAELAAALGGAQHHPLGVRLLAAGPHISTRLH